MAALEAQVADAEGRVGRGEAKRQGEGGEPPPPSQNEDAQGRAAELEAQVESLKAALGTANERRVDSGSNENSGAQQGPSEGEQIEALKDLHKKELQDQKEQLEKAAQEAAQKVSGRLLSGTRPRRRNSRR